MCMYVCAYMLVSLLPSQPTDQHLVDLNIVDTAPAEKVLFEQLEM